MKMDEKNTRKVEYVEFDVEFNETEKMFLKQLALEKIQKDDNMLINYGVRCLLSDYVESKFSEVKDDD